jgi:protein SCO1/2
MKRLRIVLWVLAGIAAVALGLILTLHRDEPQAVSLGAPAIGGPFTLTGSDGKPFSSSRLSGSPYLIFFGFTHCPDVCPTTLARLTRLRAQLPDGERKLPILFVSVDPERDGPQEVGRYSALFGTPVIGLTGSPAAIDRVKKQFGVFSEKVAGEGGDYSVDHSASVFLMDRQGKFLATISPEEGDAVALQKLRRLVA